MTLHCWDGCSTVLPRVCTVTTTCRACCGVCRWAPAGTAAVRCTLRFAFICAGVVPFACRHLLPAFATPLYCIVVVAVRSVVLYLFIWYYHDLPILPFCGICICRYIVYFHYIIYSATYIRCLCPTCTLRFIYYYYLVPPHIYEEEILPCTLPHLPFTT